MKKKNFSNATSEEIADLCFNSTSKHALENINGVHISTIFEILRRTKSVDLVKHGDGIKKRLEKAVQDKNLVLSACKWFQLPNHAELYRRRQENLKNNRRWNYGLNLPRAESLAERNSLSIKGRKRKRESKGGAKPVKKKKQKKDVVMSSNVPVPPNSMEGSKKHKYKMLHKGQNRKN